MEQKKGRTALLAGATGLVGQNILRLLVNDDSIGEISVLVRRALPEQDRGPKVRELITDLGDLEKHPQWFKVDLAFSALGTTIAAAGSQEAFRRVDYDYPLAIARMARQQGCSHFLFVSALGADSRSLVFYNRVKGELEDAVLGLGYPSVTIARPSMLLGERSERRLSEELAKRFVWLLPPAWGAVQASRVAAGLVRAAHDAEPRVRIMHNRELRKG